MPADPVQRRLAAILAADVAGYSRLMGEDEEGTRARFNSHLLELIEPAIASHRGRIVKTTGDALLVEFGSVVDAVQCAVAIQNGMLERNGEEPDNRQIIFRIGVNLGDVIIEGDDIHGDGVNVAARLEALSDPGGVLISDKVHSEIRTKLDVGFDDLGPQKVKNIAEPVRIYRLKLGGAPENASSATETPTLAPNLPSIAVLPFDNLSGDTDQEYFSDGIAEDIISALSRIRFIYVVARNSTFSYKGRNPDVRTVSTELGARYVLEGSVRKAGNRIRVTAQLIDGETGNHLWAERYDRELDDIFEVQDDITAPVVGALQPELGKAEQERAKAKRVDDLDAWDSYQRGMWHTYRRTQEDLATGIAYFRQSIAAAPEFAPAHWGAAICIFYSVIWGDAPSREKLLGEAIVLARRGVDLDPGDSMAHTALGFVRLARREHAEVYPPCQTAMELDPNNYQAPRILGFALTMSGRSAEALPLLQRALRLSPRDPLVSGTFGYIAMAYLFQKELEAAAEWARRCLRTLEAPQIWAITTAMSVFGHLGLEDEGERARHELLRFRPDIDCAFVRANIPIADALDLEVYVDGLRKAGLLE